MPNNDDNDDNEDDEDGEDGDGDLKRVDDDILNTPHYILIMLKKSIPIDRI